MKDEAILRVIMKVKNLRANSMGFRIQRIRFQRLSLNLHPSSS